MLNLVIMAAGMGSRYGGLKQIDPVGPNGETILDYSIYDAVKSGFDRVVFIIRKDIEEPFREKIGKKLEKHIDVQYVFQELDKLPNGYSCPADRQKPWGTGHAVLCASEYTQEGNSAVINADDFYGRNAFTTLANHMKAMKDGDKASFAMVGFELIKTVTENGYVSRGVCEVDGNNMLTNIVERTRIEKQQGGVAFTEDEGKTWSSLSPKSSVSMNMWGFTPSYFKELENRFSIFLDKHLNTPKSEYFVPSVVNELIQEGKAEVSVIPTDSQWYGITYKEDKPVIINAVKDYISNGIYPENLWA